MSKKPTGPPISPVQTVIGTLYRESMNANGHSWTRLNGVLRGAMHDLVRAGVKFELDDVHAAMSAYRGGYWDSTESWYASACGSKHEDGGGNLSAALSIEKHLGRTPFIWAERTKSPERLCIHKDFTWKGERVTVTSFDDANHSLTACSYTNDKDNNSEKRVGGIVYALSEYRVLEARTDYEDGSIAIRLSAKVTEERKIKKRFCITNEEMATVRAEYDARRRKHEKAIKTATTLEELDLAKKAAADEGQSAYRHFDLEIIQAAIATRREGIINDIPTDEEKAKVLKEEKRLEKERQQAIQTEWLAGGDVRPYFEGFVKLRINGDFVECSNGNKVSIEAALKTLPLVHRCRDQGWHRNGTAHDIDAFSLERIDSRGVQVGCTLIPWEEVDRFTPILKAAKKKAKVTA